MKTYYGIIGAGGYGREVVPLVRAMLQSEIMTGQAEILFVVEDIIKSTMVNGCPVVSLFDFLKLKNSKKFNIAIGNSIARERIVNICKEAGATPFQIKADNVVMMDANQIGDGAILSPFVTITSNVNIGDFFHANIYSYVAHDCIIGDYVTFAPGVKCNGRVVIGNHAYIGTGVIIKEGNQASPLTIGEGAVIGMGAVVTKDVAPHTSVIGNPARLMEKK